MAIHKNWPAICAEPDEEIKDLITLADPANTRLLDGLAKGFPELFTSLKTEFPIPLSSLVTLSQERGWQADLGGSGTLKPGLEQFKIPVVYTIGYFEDDVDDEDFFKEYGGDSYVKEAGSISWIDYFKADEYNKDCGLGKVVQLGEKEPKLIVVVALEGKIWQFAPAECINEQA